MQEAYRPPRSKYYFCYPNWPGGGYPSQVQVQTVPHPWGGSPGVHPHPDLAGVPPIQVQRGYPLARNGVPPVWTWMGGTPSLARGYPHPCPNGWGVPHPWLGVPPIWTWPGYPSPGLDGKYPIPGQGGTLARSRWGVPPVQGWMGYPPPVQGWGYPPGWTWLGYPPAGPGRGTPPPPPPGVDEQSENITSRLVLRTRSVKINRVIEFTRHRRNMFQDKEKTGHLPKNNLFLHRENFEVLQIERCNLLAFDINFESRDKEVITINSIAFVIVVQREILVVYLCG